MRKISNPRLRFVVMGDGPLREKFEKDAEGLLVTFTRRLPYEQMCGVLTACDSVVNPIVGTSAASIINKHADYAACGKPVLNTQKSDEYRKLIEEYHMGFNCDGSDELASSINLLIQDRDVASQMGKQARKCAEDRFDRARTYKSIVELIEREDY